jgi:hypothetical protein
VKQLAEDPAACILRLGEIKPDQLDVAQLKQGVVRVKPERGIAANLLPGIWAGGVVVRGARCLAGWLLSVAEAAPQSA